MKNLYELNLLNKHRRNQDYKSKISELSYTEHKYHSYLKEFWLEYAKDYIDQIEKDNSNQIREQNCKQKSINVSSIINNEEYDQSASMQINHFLHDVNQQNKANYKSPQAKFISQLPKEENMVKMKKKIQSQIVEVGKNKDSKLEVKLSEKKQIPKQVQNKIDNSTVVQTKIEKKEEFINKKVNGETGPILAIIEPNYMKVTQSNPSSEINIIKIKRETQKLENKTQLIKKVQSHSQAQIQHKQSQIKKVDIQKSSSLNKKTQFEQVSKVDQQQEQIEVIEEQQQSLYHMLSAENSKQKKAQHEAIQNLNRIENDLSNTRNTSKNQVKQIDFQFQVQYINQSSQKQYPINENYSLFVEKNKQKEDNESQKQSRKLEQNLDVSNQSKNNTNTQIKGEYQEQSGRCDQTQVQEYIDQNHFVTCIAETTLQMQIQPQFDSKMIGIEEYQSQLNVPFLQEEISENKLLNEQVDQIIQGFLNQLGIQSSFLNQKIIRLKDTLFALKQSNEKLSNEKQELSQKNQQLNAHLVQNNKKNTELVQNLQKEKKQNFQSKIKIQQMEITIKQLQEKDIFNTTQHANLSQGIKRNRSYQALLQKFDSSSNSNQVKQKNNVNDSEQESEKNSSEYSKQKKMEQNESEDQSQKNSSQLQQQSKQKVQLYTELESKLQQKQKFSSKSSKN